MRLRSGEEVEAARAAGRPVVALETTVITHGMAYPDNVETALAMEAAVRSEGACPATLAVVAGAIRIGLTEAEIERFGQARADIAKCSRRDLPALLAAGADGSLTVAGTLMLAHAAGIDLMATGGIGGVHRHSRFDVSADLAELGRTPVTVVCAGAKSILDLENTLEVLESLGVPVLGLGTTTLPAFYARDSGLALPQHVPGVAEAAAVLGQWRALAAGNGMLVTVPVPEEAALPPAEAEAAIEQAVGEAAAQGIAGSAVTPFVLARVVELTGGRSLAANKALLLNNAAVAARMALAAA